MRAVFSVWLYTSDYCHADWAYLEDWCRRLTSSFADVYVFTVPLYLPKFDADGKWRVVSSKPPLPYSDARSVLLTFKHHEVIGNPPNVAVPTHFAKVVLTSKPSSPATPHIPEISTGAFVLPNAQIPDQAPLESFVVPGMSVLQHMRSRTQLRFYSGGR